MATQLMKYVGGLWNILKFISETLAQRFEYLLLCILKTKYIWIQTEGDFVSSILWIFEGYIAFSTNFGTAVKKPKNDIKLLCR